MVASEISMLKHEELLDQSVFFASLCCFCAVSGFIDLLKKLRKT